MSPQEALQIRNFFKKKSSTTKYNRSKKALMSNCYEYSFEVPLKLTPDGDDQTGYIVIDGNIKVLPGQARNWSSNGDMIDYNDEHDIDVVGTCIWNYFETKLLVNE